MFSLPEEYVNRIRKQLGEEAQEFLESYERPYIKALRVNRTKNPNEILFGECTDEKNSPKMGENVPAMIDAENSQNSNLHKCRVAWEKRGIYYDDEMLEKPGKSPFHAAGAYYVQEASAMYPVARMFGCDKYLEDGNITPKAIDNGIRILDLCAAPGGKTTQIADYMGGKGTLIANEIIPNRAKILSENIERMGVTNALVISEEPGKLADRFPRYFDMILVDAPCSGEGMFRKHPEAAKEWSEENVRACADRQDYILDCAARMLASGGKITYSTCTFSIEEDEGSVERFLDRHPEFVQYGENHRIFPHKDLGEGHFCAEFVFKDDESTVIRKKISSNSNGNQGLTRDKIKLVSDFISSTLSKEGREYIEEIIAEGDFANRLLSFGDNIYLSPESMPNIKGLKVLRPGLQLGTIKNNRFEPAHAVALALKPEYVKNSVNISYNDACSYIRGMTVNVDEPVKGWCLVCVGGLSVGWGKATGNIIKNHYPKGLRVME